MGRTLKSGVGKRLLFVFAGRQRRIAPFFAYPAWKKDMQKILGVSTEARRSNRSPKSLAKKRSNPPLASSIQKTY